MATFAGRLSLINKSASDAVAFRENGVPKEAVFSGVDRSSIVSLGLGILSVSNFTTGAPFAPYFSFAVFFITPYLIKLIFKSHKKTSFVHI